jgi:hypothetical protein
MQKVQKLNTIEILKTNFKLMVHQKKFVILITLLKLKELKILLFNISAPQ